MLFDQLPFGILAVLLGVCCAIKHTALKRLVYAQWFQQRLWKDHKPWAVLLTAICGALMIYSIFSRFVSELLACTWGLIDFCITLGACYFAHHFRMFEIKTRHHRCAMLVIRGTYVLAYASFIWHSLR